MTLLHDDHLREVGLAVVAFAVNAAADDDLNLFGCEAVFDGIGSFFAAAAAAVADVGVNVVAVNAAEMMADDFANVDDVVAVAVVAVADADGGMVMVGHEY